MNDVHALIRQTIARHVASGAQVVNIREQHGGAQGYSGAALRYYDVEYVLPNAERAHIALVMKDAPLCERRTLAWFAEQKQPHVPWSRTDDLETDAPALVCMQNVGGEPQPPSTEMLVHAAEALASVHAANMGRIEQLPWLPRADRAYWEWFVDACLREPWQRTLRNEEFTNAFGVHWPRSTAEGSFADEYGMYTEPLEAVAAQFIDTMDQLCQAGDTLTLAHGDIHNEHVLLNRNRAYLIDWGQACYGPFLIDLPNYFDRDQVLLYRDALAAHGYDVPLDLFMDLFGHTNRYFAFKYFSLGLWAWRTGDPQRHGSMRYWLDAVLDGR